MEIFGPQGSARNPEAAAASERASGPVLRGTGSPLAMRKGAWISPAFFWRIGLWGGRPFFSGDRLFEYDSFGRSAGGGRWGDVSGDKRVMASLPDFVAGLKLLLLGGESDHFFVFCFWRVRRCSKRFCEPEQAFLRKCSQS